MDTVETTNRKNVIFFLIFTFSVASDHRFKTVDRASIMRQTVLLTLQVRPWIVSQYSPSRQLSSSLQPRKGKLLERRIRRLYPKT